MDNGNALNDLQSGTVYNNGNVVTGNKMPLLYKVPTYSHPSKRPIQSVGDVSSQNTVTVSLMNEREQQMPGQAVMHPGTIVAPTAIPTPQMQHNIYTDKKMVALQIQRDPKTGNLLMMNSNTVRPQSVIHIDNQGAQSGHITNHVTGSVGGHITSHVGNHGYHPGRHLHHQLQLKHLPQVQSSTTQLSHSSVPSVQQQQQPNQQPNQQPPQHPPQQHIMQPQTIQQQTLRPLHRTQQPLQQQQQSLQQPQQQQQAQHVLQIRQPISYQAAVVSRPYENMTYTRTYPQVNQQNCQFNTLSNNGSPNVQRARFLSSQSQTLPQILVRSASPQQSANVLTSPQQSANAMTSQQHTVRNVTPQYSGYQNHHRTATEQRLSHFDYGEHDEPPSQQFTRTPPSYQRTGETADKSSVSVASYNPVFISQGQPRTGPVIGQLRPTSQTVVCQASDLSLRRGQSLVVRGQVRPQQELVGHQSPVLTTSRPPNVVASPATSLPSSSHSPFRPVILTAQQAGQAGHPLQSTPVVVQINGGKSIRGSILSVSPQQVARPLPTTTSQNNATHVYFTIPQGNGSAKFVRTPNGHLRPVNGVAVQNSLSQSKMYTVRYVTPKTDDGKSKQQYTIYSTIAPSNNNVKIVSSSASTQEKTLIPKSRPSTPELARKRKLTPTKTSQQPAKVTKIEPKPAPSYQNTHHNELLIRVNKSLDGDREAVLKPDCNTPFESFPDTFRKLMKYHIFFEPDTKESLLKRADKLHEEISEKLLNRKENLFNKYYRRFLDDAARDTPRFVEQCDMVTLLQQQVLDEKDQLQKMKNEVERATKGREDRAKDSEDTSSPKNVSPNPEGPTA